MKVPASCTFSSPFCPDRIPTRRTARVKFIPTLFFWQASDFEISKGGAGDRGNLLPLVYAVRPNPASFAKLTIRKVQVELQSKQFNRQCSELCLGPGALAGLKAHEGAQTEVKVLDAGGELHAVFKRLVFRYSLEQVNLFFAPEQARGADDVSSPFLFAFGLFLRHGRFGFRLWPKGYLRCHQPSVLRGLESAAGLLPDDSILNRPGFAVTQDFCLRSNIKRSFANRDRLGRFIQ